MPLHELARELGAALGVQQKRDIQAAAQHLPSPVAGPWGAQPVRLGDDCAAIPDGDGFLLFAAEGMSPTLVSEEPHFAAFSAVLVNASDVYAMGGRPLAVVDTLFAPDAAAAVPLWQGLGEAAEHLGVPVVGGHTNLHSPYAALGAAVVGRAKRLLTSFDARPGDDLIAVFDLRGKMHGRYPFWNATQGAPRGRLRGDYELLPRIAESELCMAAKDISMGGLIGTTVMLCEGSGVGATLWLEDIPRPPDVPWARWLLAFPSYGFLLAVPRAHSPTVLGLFAARELAAAVVGRIDGSRRVAIAAGTERASFWDLTQASLTGFGGAS